MEGGALLAQGAYGCIFDKPLHCKRKMKKEKGKRLAKLTEDIDADQEINIATVLRNAPLSKNYFVLVDPESCAVKEVKKQDDKDIDDCDFLDRVDIRFTRQIYMKYGGKPLYEINMYPGVFNFYKFMTHMLEAAGTLLVAGICHFDIHPGNILVDSTMTPRFIDFGMAFRGDTITKAKLNLRWKVLRFGTHEKKEHWISNQEPPEVTIINAVANNDYNIDDAIQQTVYTKDIFGQISKSFLGISRTHQMKEFKEFWKSSKSCIEGDWVSFFRTYWSVFDSWTLGTLFYTYLMKQMMFPRFEHGDTWSEKQVPIQVALRGMLEINPRKRLDAIEALSILDPGNHWLSRFGSAWLSERVKQRKRLGESVE